jgi:Transposase
VIGEAWALKEAFRAIYGAADRAEAEARLDRVLGAVERAVLPAFSSFAEGVCGWRGELLAYFDEPTSNGYAAQGEHGVGGRAQRRPTKPTPPPSASPAMPTVGQVPAGIVCPAAARAV